MRERAHPSEGKTDSVGLCSREREGGRLRSAIDEIILEGLVALNKERAAEEAQGKVRWLRPDYQARGYVAHRAAGR